MVVSKGAYEPDAPTKRVCPCDETRITGITPFFDEISLSSTSSEAMASELVVCFNFL